MLTASIPPEVAANLWAIFGIDPKEVLTTIFQEQQKIVLSEVCYQGQLPSDSFGTSNIELSDGRKFVLEVAFSGCFPDLILKEKV